MFLGLFVFFFFCHVKMVTIILSFLLSIGRQCHLLAVEVPLHLENDGRLVRVMSLDFSGAFNTFQLSVLRRKLEGAEVK